MSISDVQKRLVRYSPDSWIEVDGVKVGASGCKFLDRMEFTLTKVVLPVPDIPITTMQKLLPAFYDNIN